MREEQRKRGRYWAIYDAVRGTPVIFDGRVPVYWLRSVARREAESRGFTVGRRGDVVVTRVRIEEAR